jgi:hypothetical protein
MGDADWENNMVIAISNGDIAKYRQAITPANVNTLVNEDYDTPLSWLITRPPDGDSKPFLDHLLKCGLDLSVKGKQSGTTIGSLAREKAQKRKDFGKKDYMLDLLIELNNGTYKAGDGTPYPQFKSKVPGISTLSYFAHAVGAVGSKSSSGSSSVAFNPLAGIFGAGGFRKSRKSRRSRKSRKSRKSRRV